MSVWLFFIIIFIMSIRTVLKTLKEEEMGKLMPSKAYSDCSYSTEHYKYSCSDSDVFCSLNQVPTLQGNA